MQLEQNAPESCWSELCRLAFDLPDVVERPSQVSVPGARALWLRDDAPAGPREAFMVGREFAHVHPLPEGSMHLALPPPLAEIAIAKGWAEPHPMARTGVIPETIVMIYGPRDDEELGAVWSLVQASHRFARTGPADSGDH
jgi:phospholipase/carboxylesterase